jgi:hypothetical protein
MDREITPMAFMISSSVSVRKPRPVWLSQFQLPAKSSFRQFRVTVDDNAVSARGDSWPDADRHFDRRLLASDHTPYSSLYWLPFEGEALPISWEEGQLDSYRCHHGRTVFQRWFKPILMDNFIRLLITTHTNTASQHMDSHGITVYIHSCHNNECSGLNRLRSLCRQFHKLLNHRRVQTLREEGGRANRMTGFPDLPLEPALGNFRQQRLQAELRTRVLTPFAVSSR